jgi:NifU-like protein involved in Fe-S cluster formation
MDEAVIKYYRRLLKMGFDYAGSIENPSIFLDSVYEKIPVCGQVGRDYLHLYINIRNGVIDNVKYLCTCDPTANVAFEILCTLIKNKTLAEAKAIHEASFTRILGSNDEDFIKKVKGLLELLNRGFTRYESRVAQN